MQICCFNLLTHKILMYFAWTENKMRNAENDREEKAQSHITHAMSLLPCTHIILICCVFFSSLDLRVVYFSPRNFDYMAISVICCCCCWSGCCCCCGCVLFHLFLLLEFLFTCLELYLFGDFYQFMKSLWTRSARRF